MNKNFQYLYIKLQIFFTVKHCCRYGNRREFQYQENILLSWELEFSGRIRYKIENKNVQFHLEI